MCTPWTISRLVRWRVKDWALSFFACGFPLDEEERETHPPSSPQVSIANMVFDTKDGTRKSKKKSKRGSRGNKCKQEKQRVTSGSVQAIDTGLAENRSITEDSSWPHFADEDYIVFCFREDGAFDVVKDCKSEGSGHVGCAIKSPRPVNRKLNYAGDAETVYNHSHEVLSKEDGHNINSTNKGESISDKEADEEDRESVYLDTESPSRGMRKGDQFEENIGDQCRTVSLESNDSNQSEGSTGSFAFPVLRWELSSSPAQMPKSEGLRLRKHKARHNVKHITSIPEGYSKQVLPQELLGSLH
ncbi:hypothetical protein L1049_028170 [Liquidambar formosana]|uniref:Protein BREAKING OF ASYMMETRY IN THE STOMATAL LINEAGE n=1 Tax=Liquidambar formosana TaxID=63359 RepID=A0AAP0RK14_LIQFO